MTEETTNTEQKEENNPKTKKPKSKARKIIEWVLFGIFGALFVIVLAGNISAMVHKDENYQQSLRFGYGSFVILTDSMEPEYHVNNAIITYKENAGVIYEQYKAGQVVDLTFVNIDCGFELEDSEIDTERFKSANGGQKVVSNQIMTHRLIEMHIRENINYGEGKYVFITSGINDGGSYSKQGQYQLFTEKQCLGEVKINSAFLGGIFSFVGSPFGLLILLLIPAGYLIVTSGIDIYKALEEKEKLEEEQTTTSSSGEGGKLDTLSEADRERLKQELLEEMLNKKQNNEEK